jgi:hypothetical protein
VDEIPQLKYFVLGLKVRCYLIGEDLAHQMDELNVISRFQGRGKRVPCAGMDGVDVGTKHLGPSSHGLRLVPAVSA